jgi:hypothetical protein
LIFWNREEVVVDDTHTSNPRFTTLLGSNIWRIEVTLTTTSTNFEKYNVEKKLSYFEKSYNNFKFNTQTSTIEKNNTLLNYEKWLLIPL